MIDTLPENVSPLIVLFVLAGTALSILAAEHWRVHWRLSAWVALAALVVAPVLGAIVILSGQGGTLRGMIWLEGGASLRAWLASLAAGAAILLDLSARRQVQGPRYALILFSVCGIVTAAQAQHLIPLVLGVVIGHVALTGLSSTRAGWASYGLVVVGVSALLLATVLVYGATGSLHLDQINDRLAGGWSSGRGNSLAVLALAFLLAGLGVLLGVVPFHTWIHTVLAQTRLLEGYIVAALGPQLALAVLAHLVDAWPPRGAELVLLIASASVPYGYARALRATTVGEVLAGIATGQTGVLLGHAFVARDGTQSMAYYALGSYVLNAMCLWAVSSQLPMVSHDRFGSTPFAGAGRRTPWLGVALAACLLNIAGLYPFAGAFVQISLFQAVFSTGQVTSALLVVVGNALAWFLSVKLARQAWAAPIEQASGPRPSLEASIVALGSAAVMLLAGLNAGGAWHWISSLAAGP